MVSIFRFICSQYPLIFVTGLIENKCLDKAVGNRKFRVFTVSDGFKEACTEL